VPCKIVSWNNSDNASEHASDNLFARIQELLPRCERLQDPVVALICFLDFRLVLPSRCDVHVRVYAFLCAGSQTTGLSLAKHGMECCILDENSRHGTGLHCAFST